MIFFTKTILIKSWNDLQDANILFHENILASKQLETVTIPKLTHLIREKSDSKAKILSEASMYKLQMETLKKKDAILNRISYKKEIAKLNDLRNVTESKNLTFDFTLQK